MLHFHLLGHYPMSDIYASGEGEDLYNFPLPELDSEAAPLVCIDIEKSLNAVNE